MLSVALIFVLGYFDIIKSSYLSTFLIQGIVMLAFPITLYSALVTKNVKQTFSDFGFKKISFIPSQHVPGLNDGTAGFR